MNDPAGLNEFKEGVKLLRQRYPANAMVRLRKAVELDRENPYYISFLGVAIALARSKWSDAEKLCAQALKQKRDEAQFYVNLAEVYLAAERKEDAVETLTTGLKYTGRSKVILEALHRIEPRRRPLVPFLSRGNPLNRMLGRLRHRVVELARKKKKDAR